MTTLVFTEVGIPLEAVALIAGIDRILDMIRTSVNVLGDCLTALVVSKSEGVLGTEPMDQDLSLIHILPKPNEGTRMLGIPTLLDRTIQQAIVMTIGDALDVYKRQTGLSLSF